MLDLWLTALFAVLNIVLPYAIVRRDRQRLDAAQLARAWNRPTFACAIYFFGPLSLPAHFWVTRQRPIALLQGAVWATAVLAGELLLGELLDRIFA